MISEAKKHSLITFVKATLTAMLLVALSIPAFSMTGLIVKPLLICVVGCIIICLGLSLLKDSETVCGLSLLLFVSFWSAYALIKQLLLQAEQGFPGKWIFMFYFDKFLIVGTIWLSCVIFYSVLSFVGVRRQSNYRLFYRYSSISFIIFYTFLLIYSFVLIRLDRGVYPLNWVPFNTIKDYISDYSSIPYEVFMMFFGNLFYFTPLGIIFYLMLKNKKTVFKMLVIAIFPPIAFSLLEYSQFLLQIGFCEFDDMMMNSIGFWLGAVFGCLADKAVYKLSKGRLKSFWG